jgi:Zn-dependent protease
MAFRMPTLRSGGINLFKVFGIQVSLHWMWILVAFYEIETGKNRYSSIVWNIAEYLTLFLIVLLHEFGHALACRSVGGKADHIMLWPLGGVAFVSPPPRPGAVLWSIVAGPLVNVILVPVTVIIRMMTMGGSWLPLFEGLETTSPQIFATSLLMINAGLLIFNMLPIYPLDGGQILQSLLWFVIGRARSLLVASVIGMIGAAGAVLLALYIQDTWLIVLAAFGALRSWGGFKQSRALSKLLALPRHEQFRCPTCREAPLAYPIWRCACGAQFDAFVTGARCPQCGNPVDEALCVLCRESAPFAQWVLPAPPVQAQMAPAV